MTLNRLSGLLAGFVGMLLLFWIIPNHTETADSGWLKPSTLPNITAIIIILSGGIHFLFPKGSAKLDLEVSARAGLFLGIGVLGVSLMHMAGFIIAAPVLMLVLMLTVGERRWPWLVIGVILLPAFIWFCVDFLLKRPLP